MNIANAAMIFGVIFLLAGLAGFFATPPPPGAPPLIVGMVMGSRSASFPSTRCTTLSVCCSACSALPRPEGRWSRRVNPAYRRGRQSIRPARVQSGSRNGVLDDGRGCPGQYTDGRACTWLCGRELSHSGVRERRAVQEGTVLRLSPFAARTAQLDLVLISTERSSVNRGQKTVRGALKGLACRDSSGTLVCAC